jgi:integrase
MSVFKRTGSPVYQYSFYVDGRRFRGSTKTRKITEARAKESALITRIIEEGTKAAAKPVRAPLLRTFAPDFLAWVQNSRLKAPTKAYYERGWKLLAATRLSGMRMDRITGDDVEATRIMHEVKEGEVTVTVECDAHYANRALRTLKRMFSKAVEWKLLKDQPHFRLLEAYGRDTKISAAVEKSLLGDLSEPMVNKRNARMRRIVHDVIVIAQDTGMRPSEIFRMRVEDLDFATEQAWNPHGKTLKSRRFVPISERMAELLAVRCGERKEGWVFPSARSKSGHIETIAKGFQALRTRAGVSSKVVLYSARHTYGSYALAATGNLFAVAASMGHVDTKSMEPYQHHDLHELRDAINVRNREASVLSGHNFGHIRSSGTSNGSEVDQATLNTKELLVGPEGFEPPTKGL